MKIIVFGGAGDIGSRAVEDLASADGVERVTIADRNVAAAEKIAARLAGGAVVDVARVDANDHDGLVAAMSGYDVAASALGPFHVFEKKLARAAVEAGVNYASVCDDWNAAEDTLDEFDAGARAKGCVVLTGLGTSPGITNMGVKLLAREMDTVRRADISVYQPLDGGGEAVIRHVLFIMSGEVAGFEGGERRMIRACARSSEVEFPRFGRVRVWNMGHTEPVTVHRFFPGMEEVNFRMGYGRGSGLFVVPSRLGLFESRAVVEAVTRTLAQVEKLLPSHGTTEGAVRIDVYGAKDRKEEHGMVCGIGNMREATGLSLSVGALMLARGELTVKTGGAFAPEGCLDPDVFFSRLAEKGIRSFRDIAMTKPVV